jgi:hypothetical protein
VSGFSELAASVDVSGSVADANGQVALYPYGPVVIPVGGTYTQTFTVGPFWRTVTMSVLAGADSCSISALGNNSARGIQVDFGPGNSTTRSSEVNPGTDTELILDVTGTPGDTVELGLVANIAQTVVQLAPDVTPILTDSALGLFTLGAGATRTVYTNPFPTHGNQFLQGWRLAVLAGAAAGVYDAYLTLAGIVLDHVILGPAGSVNEPRRIRNGGIAPGTITLTAGAANPAAITAALTVEVTNTIM